jgi:anaerobic dimethyl sulfoxide reductase subunit B (iron-sulfur subunit)
MACKINNDLPDDTWFATVRTLGNGEGIDRPQGVWPNLKMSWIPIFNKECMLCAARTKAGEPPHCVNSCPTLALTYGDVDDASAEVAVKLAEMKESGCKVFKLPAWENSKDAVIYTTKR